MKLPLIKKAFRGIKPVIYEGIDTNEVYTRGFCWVYAGAMNFVHGLGIYTISGHVFNLFKDNPIDIMGYHYLDEFFDWWGVDDLEELAPCNYESWLMRVTSDEWSPPLDYPFEGVLADALFRAKTVDLENLI